MAGIFANAFASKAAQAGAAQAFAPEQMTWADRLNLIGGALKDMGTMGDSDNMEKAKQTIAGRAMAVQQLAMQRKLGGLFGGAQTQAAPAAPLPAAGADINMFAGDKFGPAPTQTFGGDSQQATGGPPSMEQAMPLLAQAQAAGINATPYLEMLKAMQPHVQSVSKGAALLDDHGKVIGYGPADNGVADGFSYTTDPATGMTKWTSQRPQSYSEQLSRDQLDYQKQHDRTLDRFKSVEAGASATNANTGSSRNNYEQATGKKPGPWNRSWK